MDASVSQDRADELNATRVRGFERLLAAATLATIVGTWAIAATLTPDSRGLGTHEQLGLVPCRTVTIFGIPCVFCGMTTSFSLLAHAEPLAALTVQPAGVAIAVSTIPAAWGAFVTVCTGTVPLWASRLATSVRARKVAFYTLGLAWVYKIVTFL